MSHIPDLDALFSAERATAPASSAVHHGWLRLSQDLAANVAPLAVASGPLKHASWLIAKWLLSGLALGFVGAGVVVAAMPRSAAVPSAARAEPSVVIGASAAAAIASAASIVVSESAPVLAPSAAITAAAPAAPSTPSASVSAASPTTFDAELALISRAKSAVDAGQFVIAESALRQHAASFPQGVFATERDGLLVLAACERGPKNPKLAENFAKLHPGAALSARLSRACSPAPSDASSATVDFSKLPNEPSPVGEPTTEPRTGK